MLLLSATEAISPALTRTRNLLFRPFKWGSFLKLCLVAVFAEGFSGGFNSGFSNSGRTTHIGTTHIGNAAFPAHLDPSLIPILIPILLAFVALVFLVAIALFYLVVRLRFALFHCLVYQSREIKPGWRIYREPAGRFFWLSIGVGIVFLLVFAAIAAPFLMGFIRLFRDYRGGSIPLGPLFSLLLPLLPLLLLAALASIAVRVILQDFMLPHFALENATVGQAWAAARMRMVQEKGQFLAYTALRILAPLVVSVAVMIALLIPGLILGVIGFLIAGVLRAALGKVVFVVAIALMAIFVFAFIFCGIVCLGGPICIAKRSYALMFYGSRFPALGNLLSPQEPPPALEETQPGMA